MRKLLWGVVGSLFLAIGSMAGSDSAAWAFAPLGYDEPVTISKDTPIPEDLEQAAKEVIDAYRLEKLKHRFPMAVTVRWSFFSLTLGWEGWVEYETGNRSLDWVKRHSLLGFDPEGAGKAPAGVVYEAEVNSDRAERLTQEILQGYPTVTEDTEAPYVSPRDTIGGESPAVRCLPGDPCFKW